MVQGELSFSNPHTDRVGEVGSKYQIPAHSERFSERGLPTKLQVEISNACRGNGARKTKEEKNQNKTVSALRVLRKHMKLNQIYATRNRACFPPSHFVEVWVLRSLHNQRFGTIPARAHGCSGGTHTSQLPSARLSSGCQGRAGIQTS